ncbi:sensor histidine kinase [Microbacterium sp. RD1]|uniref:sensor histidine kinase n=1 Tax=Microbacterium sp. RD1 TaxID=3457313 RepID=UPI003FA5EDF3
MTAIIGMVAVILAIIALSTGAILGQVLQDNLDKSVREAVSYVRLGLDSTAQGVLGSGPFADGTLLVTQTVIGGTTGAYVDGNTVRTLTDDEISAIITSVRDSSSDTVEIPELGDYRIQSLTVSGQEAVAVLGLPLSEITSTISQILITVALVTTGGLLLLSSIIAIVVRIGLRPLRAVADTATRVANVRMDSGDVSITQRVPADQTDESTEIGQVGAALNSLLEHVDASLSARQRNEELMRRFVADASHELRTPLASIRGYSELSLRDATLGENTHAALERIQAQSLRMTALVEDLLLLARLEEGTELVYGSVDLTQLVIEAVGDARPAGLEHRWVLDVDDDPVVLAGDASRLQQVIANLLANARTHTPGGTTVTVSVRRDGDEAELRVHDDGPGVDPAIAEELFERFSRGDASRARRTGGTGLGLSIARAIVQAHRGALTVQSTPGDTTFEVRLPARPADPEMAAQ